VTRPNASICAVMTLECKIWYPGCAASSSLVKKRHIWSYLFEEANFVTWRENLISDTHV
jgi:hypothetical protein